MKCKKLPALLSALAILAATVPALAVDEGAPPPIEREVVVIDEADAPVVDEDAAFMAEGVAAAADDSGTQNVAQIGETTYTSLSEAVTNAQDGDTIKLTDSININTYIKMDKSLTLDLNGNTLQSSHPNGTILVWGGNLTIIDHSNDKTGKVIGTNKYAVWVYKGSLTLESGTLEYSGSTTGCAARISLGTSMIINGGTVTGPIGIKAQGTLIINSGMVTGTEYGVDTFNSTDAEITINGGTVSSHQYGIYSMGTLTINNGAVQGDTYGIIAKETSAIEINGGVVEGVSEDTSQHTYGIYSQGKLTINSGTVRAVNGPAVSGNGSNGLGNTEFIINGGEISGVFGIYHPQQNGKMIINGGTITGSETGIEIRGGEVEINGGTISGNGTPTASGPNTSGSTTVGAGIAVVQHTTKCEISLTVNSGTIRGYTPLYEKNVQQNEDEDIEKITLNIAGGFFKFINGGSKAADSEDKTNYMTGGTYDSKIPYKYIAEGYIRRDNHDGTYTVTKPYTIIDKDRTINAEIELCDLKKNETLNEAGATYKVVVSEVSEDDNTAIDNAMEENNDKNTRKALFDISVQKTDINGITTDISEGFFKQSVKIILNDTPQNAEDVKVYLINDQGEVEPISADAVGNTVTFTAPILSTYAITYNAAEITADNIADEIGVVFSPVADGGNQYYIILKPLAENKWINRYMSADIVFKKTCENGAIDYEIEPIAYTRATVAGEDKNSREYHFEMDGINRSDESCAYGTGITIGTITFNGFGKLDFRVDTEYTAVGHDINIANTAKMADNIVDHYTVADTTLVVNESVDNSPALKADESGTIQDVLYPAASRLNVNIVFNNAVNNNAYDYQDMTLTISGGDLTADKVIKLGTEPYMENTDADVVFDEDACAYRIMCDELTRNIAYTVKVEGAGYRTARHLVWMNGDKTLNFWNNVKDNDDVIEEGKTAMKSNFLAGDIVKDNNINLYDLSAVVSYFGAVSLTENNHPEYAKYDLNRDGVIDSKDIAYVLVSWDN